jgi:hypothetical protein
MDFVSAKPWAIERCALRRRILLLPFLASRFGPQYAPLPFFGPACSVFVASYPIELFRVGCDVEDQVHVIYDRLAVDGPFVVRLQDALRRCL